MSRLQSGCLLSGLLWIVITAAAHAEQDGSRRLTAEQLAAAEPLVIGHCTACHSLKLIASQRGNAKFWLDTIRWMQNTQKLWVIPAEQERQIVAYLSQTYAEEVSGRRPPLPLSLQDQQHWP